MPATNKPSIPGVQVRVWVHGTKNELVINENGSLGKLTPQKLKLALWLQNDAVEVLSVLPESSGNQSVRFMKNHARQDLEGPDRYAQKIQVHVGSPPSIHANQNRIVLTEAIGHGRVRLHELALVTDHGECFLVHQADDLQAFMGEVGPVLPKLANWRFEEGMVETILGNQEKLDLVSLKDYRYPEAPSLKGLGDKEGIIDWWSDARGSGEMLTKKQRRPVAVRRDSFLNHEFGKLNTLERGQKVSFTKLEEIKNRHGVYMQVMGLHPLQEAPAQAVV